MQGGIKKKKRRYKGAKNFRQRQDAAQQARRGSALHEGPVLPSRDVNRIQLRVGLLTTSTSANVYSEAEPLGGFCIGRPQTRAWCGGGIALSHQRAGCSAVSAGGTGHARSLGSRSVVTGEPRQAGPGRRSGPT